MRDRHFFDTTILIYCISEHDRRSSVAESLIAAGGFISVQVLNEFVAVARRKLHRSWKEINQALAEVRILCEPALPLTVKTHEAALKIADRYGYRICDALILASAAEAGCSTLYSEDMQGAQKIGSLTILNPFENC